MHDPLGVGRLVGVARQGPATHSAGPCGASQTSQPTLRCVCQVKWVGVIVLGSGAAEQGILFTSNWVCVEFCLLQLGAQGF